MSYTRVAIYLGILVFVALCVLDGIGFGVLTPILVTAGALVLLVAGGNWLNARPSPMPTRPPARTDDAGDPAEGE